MRRPSGEKRRRLAPLPPLRGKVDALKARPDEGFGADGRLSSLAPRGADPSSVDTFSRERRRGAP
jgi:hypothetical protein